jgi:PAS domain S-box-containing protein
LAIDIKRWAWLNPYPFPKKALASTSFMSDTKANAPLTNSPKRSWWQWLGSIRGQLIISFVAITILLTTFVSLVIYQISQSTNQVSYLVNVLENSRIYGQKLGLAVSHSNQHLQTYLLAWGESYQSQSQLETYQEQRARIWRQELPAITDSLKQYAAQWTGVEEKLMYANLLSSLENLRNAQDLVESYRSSTYSDEDLKNQLSPKEVFRRDVLPVTQKILKDIETLDQIHLEKLRTKGASLAENLSGFSLLLVGIIIISLLISLYMTIRFSNQLIRDIRTAALHTKALAQGNLSELNTIKDQELNAIIDSLQKLQAHLRRLQDFAAEVSKGNFESQIAVFEANSDIGKALSDMRQGLTEVAIQARQRNRTNEGIALFSNILRQNYEDDQQTYDEFISTLVRYVEANQGSIFIVNDDNREDHYLETKALYAYERKRFETRQIRMGQGLVGQVWREKDTLYLTEIPENFVRISSGLGGESPRCVLIVPIMANDTDFLGAIELASFRYFEPYEIDFVKRISEILASMVSTIQKNKETQILLDEAREATEEMSAQEEEMRQNMDQLISTQEEMEAQLLEYRWQTLAINSYTALIELAPQGYIRKANAVFLEELKYDLPSLKKLSYDALIPENIRNHADYEVFWEALSQGFAQVGQFQYQAQDLSEVWMLGSFTPIKNHHGDLIKIIGLLLPNTEMYIRSSDAVNRLDTLYKSHAIIEYDTKGYIIQANTYGLEILGYADVELRNKPHYTLVEHEERYQRSYQEFWKRLAKGEVIRGRFKRIHKDGTERWLQSSYCPVFEQDGQVYKIVEISQDITEVIQSDLETHRQLEQVSKQKEDLLRQNSSLLEREKRLTLQLREYQESN